MVELSLKAASALTRAQHLYTLEVYRIPSPIESRTRLREVIAELRERLRHDEAAALATVVATYHSAPRPPGAAMLRSEDDTALGSLSGGCIEGAVFELAGEVLNSGVPALVRYGVSDDDAFAVGLPCGGAVEVFVQRMGPEHLNQLDAIAEGLLADRPVALAIVVEHPEPAQVGHQFVVGPDWMTGAIGSPACEARVAKDVRGLLAAGVTKSLEYGPNGEPVGEGIRLFVSSFAPRPRMIVFGAIDYAGAVAAQGRLIGYHVTVCDARATFATSTRFPDVDDLVVDWPHRYLSQQIAENLVDDRTVVCVLTHDPKFDVPALQVAFTLPARAYIGAMGSRRTHQDRLQRLREAGATDEQIARIHSPIGLDLGARTPAETAVSIAAEIIATRRGGHGIRLSDTTGPIHNDFDADKTHHLGASSVEPRELAPS